MVRCPNCGHEELPGALFCGECGAKLNSRSVSDADSTQLVQLGQLQEQSEAPAQKTKTEPSPPAVTNGAKVVIRIVDSGQQIPLAEKDEFTLGRVSEGQPLIPEIDLSPHNAYEQGVSRLHAVIGVHDEHVTITDLGSANGTWVNGVRVIPHTAQELQNGDLVTLGTLKIQAVIKS